jgi:hypothetical protein
MPTMQLSGEVQVKPQEPQLFMSVIRSTQLSLQTLSPLLGQFPHTPLLQTPTSPAPFVAQVVPHAPQLFGSVCSSVQIPLQT